MKRDKPRNASIIGFLSARNSPATLAIIVTLLCITPALFAQRDVRASLIVAGGSKTSAAVSPDCREWKAHTPFELSR